MISPEAKINLNNFKSNIQYIKSLATHSKVLPVIKANAYGHGCISLLKTLFDESLDTVCVATYDEIIEILNAQIPFNIIHLGKIFLSRTVINDNIIFTINSIDDIDYINKTCSQYSTSIRCHIKVDTGMRRMGCSIQDFEKLAQLAYESKFIRLESVYSHLASSDDKSSEMNKKQINAFLDIIDKSKKYNLKYHLLNSGGLFNFSKYSFDFVRTGLSIYGVSSLKNKNNKLKPVMELTAPIIFVKDINKGDSVGYGCTYKAKKNMKIAIVQCGYADGLPIEFSNRGYVFLNNYKFPIIGKVSMDLFCIDISLLENPTLLTNITIWGGFHEESRLEFISEKFNTIPYKLLTSLSTRVKRVYV